jgi:hypothetical protein
VTARRSRFLLSYVVPRSGCVALTKFEDLDALIAGLKSKGTTFRGDVVHGSNCDDHLLGHRGQLHHPPSA